MNSFWFVFMKSVCYVVNDLYCRIVSKDYSSHLEEIFTDLKVPNIQQLIDFDIASLIYKS